MADNVTTEAVTTPGADFATDEIGGVHYPRTKVGHGADGAYVDTSDADPFPTKNDALLSALVARLAPLLSSIPDNTTPAAPVRPVGEDITTGRFARTGSGLLSPQMTQIAKGAGVTVSQATGSLIVAMGTTATDSFLARSVSSWRGSMIANVEHLLSQRIANNNFAVVLADLVAESVAFTQLSATVCSVTIPSHGFTTQDIGQFMFLGGVSLGACPEGRYALASVPDANTVNFTVSGWAASGSGTLTVFGHHHAKVLYDGTTATAAQYATQAAGWANADKAITTATSASPGHLITLHQSGRQNYVGDQAVASATAPVLTNRGSSVRNIPDDNKDLYLFLWAYNGASAPASKTTWTVGHWAVEKYANQPVYLAGARPQGTQPPMPVSLPGTQAVSFTQPALVAGTAYIGRTALPALAKTDRPITMSTTSQQAAAANATRTLVVIQNQDAAINIFLNVGAAATAGAGSIRIAPGATYELYGSTGTINLIAASGTPLVTVWEF